MRIQIQEALDSDLVGWQSLVSCWPFWWARWAKASDLRRLKPDKYRPASSCFTGQNYNWWKSQIWDCLWRSCSFMPAESSQVLIPWKHLLGWGGNYEIVASRRNILFFYKHLYIPRECMHIHAWGREGAGGGREKIPSSLHASAEPDTGLPSHDHEMMTRAGIKSQMLNQLSHPGAPREGTF